MKQVVIYLVVMLCSISSFSQKKTEAIIPPDAARKVEKAKKLYNELKVFEGEKILKDLIKEHPNDCYYQDALLQMQRQVLRFIIAARGELGITEANHLTDSSETADLDWEVDTGKAKLPNTDSIKTNDTEELNFGLDRSRQKQKIENSKGNQEEQILTEAIVTIDSSLLKPELDENGDTVKKVSRTEKKLQKQLKAVNDLALIPYEGYRLEFINNARRATLFMDCLDSASFYLREVLLDSLPIDRYAPDDAKEAYEEGYILFKEKNYPAALKYFQKAVNFYEDYFHARLRLAETMLIMNKDSDAFKEFRIIVKQFPERPEPFVKLASYFYQTGKYMDAAAAIIDAICIYPEQDYFHFLNNIILKTGKGFNPQWIKREVYPLNTSKVMEEILALEKTPWWQYQAAKQEVHSYYDTLGLVRPNEKTNERYLEIYGWKKMLNNTGRDQFLFARAMEKIDYLDCYVFITLFHQDLYYQFHDFSKSNKEKIKKYFYLLMNWDHKKFDKLRDQVAPPKKTETKEKETPKK